MAAFSEFMLECRELANDTERSAGYAFNKVTTVNQFGAAALIARQMYLLCSMKVSSVCDDMLEEMQEDNTVRADMHDMGSSQGSRLSCIVFQVLPTYGPGLLSLLVLALACKVRGIEPYAVPSIDRHAHDSVQHAGDAWVPPASVCRMVQLLL